MHSGEEDKVDPFRAVVESVLSSHTGERWLGPDDFAVLRTLMLLAAVDGTSAFAELGARDPRRHELAAGWLYRREWNLVKLTGRGLKGHGEAFAVQVLPDAVVIRFR